MAITKKRSSSDEDFLNVGPDATATFDNSPSNPTEHASSENLDAIDADTDEDELEDEDLDEDEEEEEYDDEDDEDEEYEDDDEEDDDDDDDDDDEEDDENDHDLARGPKAPSVYRKG